MSVITVTDARKAFVRWVEAVGGKTTTEARAADEPITGTFNLEEWRIGDGRTTVRIAEIVNENGGTRDPMGYLRMSSREFVAAMSVAISTLEVARKIQAARVLVALAGE